MSEFFSYVPEEARRDQLGPELMRRASDLPIVGEKIERWLDRRAEWMVEAAGIQKHLAPKITWREPGNTMAGAEKGVRVLCVGAGKGHEADEIDAVLPASEVIALDPHDTFTSPVKARAETLAHDLRYLPKTETAEHLSTIADGSLDGATLFFTLHHIDEQKYGRVFSELQRVLAPDGKLFVAEDIVDTAEERKQAQQTDQLLNVEVLHAGAHVYKSRAAWEAFFAQQGFDVIEAHEEQPDKVRHAFFVLRKKTSLSQ